MVDTFIPIFRLIVEGREVLNGRVRGILGRMDQTSLMVTLFFTFLLGAGIGFYVARLVF